MASTLRVRSPVIRTHQHGVAPGKELEATVTVLVPFPAKASAKSTHLSASAIINMWQLLAGDCCGRQSCASRIPVRIWREEKCGARENRENPSTWETSALATTRLYSPLVNASSEKKFYWII